MLPADGYIRRPQALDVPIQREHFPVKPEEPQLFTDLMIDLDLLKIALMALAESDSRLQLNVGVVRAGSIIPACLRLTRRCAAEARWA